MAETSMVEQVAIALEPMCRAFGKGDMPMQVAREFARAAFEAMREPTDVMAFAGETAIINEKRRGSLWQAKYCWDAMLAAALQEPSP